MRLSARRLALFRLLGYAPAIPISGDEGVQGRALAGEVSPAGAFAFGAVKER